MAGHRKNPLWIEHSAQRAKHIFDLVQGARTLAMLVVVPVGRERFLSAGMATVDTSPKRLLTA